ncbi:MAG: ABC-F family ATP-binding cassette domain-containing protein [Prevotellaceae bacterium]|jgi:ATP-binding cassette subfamily F protein uup|nr:ABC-F family ATP-binding cassette domain-containing protein [Prevotellaceae bacterium]
MAANLQGNNLTKTFGPLLLFENINFVINEGQRIGLIARNGSGKTTLLNIIAGKEEADAGEIMIPKDVRVAYLEQDPQFLHGTTVMQACNNIKDRASEQRAKKILTQLNITCFEQKVEELSGGQIKRVALANVLAAEPDLLLLDEPTNHLDLDMTEWLEDYLRRSKLSLLMVTHDRYFLDHVCSDIIEIDRKKLYQYKGNYSYYLEKRQERITAENAELDHANNLFRRELEWMRRQPQARTTKAKSRIDAFYDLEEKVKQQREQGIMKLKVQASYVGTKIFEAQYVSKSFGDVKILKDFHYIFKRYEKLGIVGNNGTGKSTFVKMLTGEIPPDSGRFDVGETVRFGYYSQAGLEFNESMRVIDVVREIAEEISLGKGKKLTASQFLQHFQFTPETQHNYVAKLSGGERRRLYLCTVLIRNPNFLILDEPTNDLDIVTLNVLEDYLQSFNGCVIVVSHDRYFMDKVVNHLLVFHGNAEIKNFPGNYSDYRWWKEENVKREQAQQSKQQLKQQKDVPKPQGKVTEKKKLSYKEQREFETLEQEIAELEAKKQQLELDLSSGSLNYSELMEKLTSIVEVNQLLDDKTFRWLELSELA